MGFDRRPVESHIEPDRPSFLERALPHSFDLRVVTIGPGVERAFDETEWRDALIIVVHGEIELECSSGAKRPFGCGDILWFAGLRLRIVRHRGRDPALLVAISRRHPDGGGVDRPGELPGVTRSTGSAPGRGSRRPPG